jgi:hypothetical protein
MVGLQVVLAAQVSEGDASLADPRGCSGEDDVARQQPAYRRQPGDQSRHAEIILA